MTTDLTIVAMSGGVDSSATAAVLKRDGHRLIGITMRVWEQPEGVESRHGACCSIDDADDARRVAETLGIPHYTVNVKERFKKEVVDYFTAEYMRGRTPNPCVLCNQAIKFDHLFELGGKFGARRIATGHYAAVDTFRGHRVIRRGRDRNKDQSYFLFSMDPARLDSVLFPLGDYTKAEARSMAEENGLNVANKPESQEICFIPDNDYKTFLAGLPEARTVREGDIVDENGHVIGRHRGYPYYTIGQRRGLMAPATGPLYVSAIEPKENRLVAGGKDALYANALEASGVNWFVPPAELADVTLTAKIRYQSHDEPVTIFVKDSDTVKVEFHDPQLSITPGQAVVFYHNEYVVGGGWIEKRLD